MKRTISIIKLYLQIRKFGRWAKVVDDPLKRQVCQFMHDNSAVIYNEVKPWWMPAVGKSVMKA